jgi:hypothetical protein
MFSNDDLVQEAMRLWYKLQISDQPRMVIATNFHNERILALIALAASAMGHGVIVHQSVDDEHKKMTYLPIWGRFFWLFKRPTLARVMNQIVKGKTPKALPKNALEEAVKLIVEGDEIVITAYV